MRIMIVSCRLYFLYVMTTDDIYSISLHDALPILPFLVAAALAGITLVLSASLLRETRPPGSNGSHAQQPGTAKRTAVPGMLILLAVFGIVQFIGQAPGSTRSEERRVGKTGRERQ